MAKQPPRIPSPDDWIGTQAFHRTLEWLATGYQAGLDLYNAIRQALPGLARGFYTTLYNVSRAINQQGIYWRSVPPSFRPLVAQIPLAGRKVSKGLAQGRYRYTVRLNPPGGLAGYNGPQYISVFSNINKSIGAVIEAAYSWLITTLSMYPTYNMQGILIDPSDFTPQVTRIARYW